MDDAFSYLTKGQEFKKAFKLAIESNDFEKLIGHPVTPISEALSQMLNQISQTEN
jgi:NAD(P)H dehydrogenase (quinone)